MNPFGGMHPRRTAARAVSSRAAEGAPAPRLEKAAYHRPETFLT